MTVGYDRLLYVLPFDHRHSYEEQVFGFHEPLTADQIATVAASKQVIYEGFKKAVAAGIPKDRAAILVDQEFGAAILRDARQNGFLTALSTEKSGQEEFDFEYGEQFAEHLDEFQPTFAKVLVRYNPQGDPEHNRRQTARLKRLSDDCVKSGRLLMFELLVPPEPAQLQHFKGNKRDFDLQLRPQLMIEAIQQIQDAGVEPAIWKIEGLDQREDCVNIVAAVRRGGRSTVSCIVLGRGEDEKQVLLWLRVAAGVPGFIGFAVGRSTFLEPILSLRAGKSTADAAAWEIARRFREWTDLFDEARGNR
jgi:5-dehydro-2-deoxygluconokinase